MGYDLVFQDSDDGKAFGDNVYFENLPADYKVYVFSYPGDMPDLALEDRLRKLGEIAGQNIYVNIGRLDDPQYSRISSRFGIRNYPAIIVTAVDALATPPGEYCTAFAKLDDKRLLASPERTAACVLEVCNLFLQGQVAEAISHAKGRQRVELIKAVAQFFTGKLKALLASIELSYSVADGKFVLKQKG